MVVPPDKRRSYLPWLVACTGLILLMCLGGGAGATVYLLEHEPADSAAAEPTSTPGRTAPPGDLVEPSPSPTATAPAVIPTDRVYRGRGDKVVHLSLSTGLRHVAAITHGGNGNVAVWTLDAAGQRRGLVVNSIGRYSGVRPLDFDETPHALKIEADGAWTVTIRAFAKTPLWNGSSSGRNPVVLRLHATGAPEPIRVALTHRGSQNFIVHVYGQVGPGLLVNEIGRFSGQVTIPRGAVAVAIEAEAAWTIKKA